MAYVIFSFTLLPANNEIQVTFSIGSVKDIQWNDGAFESLVLPEDHKELILALTQSHVQNKDGFDDVIQGKGISLPMIFGSWKS